MRKEQQEILSSLTVAMTLVIVLVTFYAVAAEDGKDSKPSPGAKSAAEVTTVESEIGLEQIVVRKEKPAVAILLEDSVAAAEPVVTKKEAAEKKPSSKHAKAAGRKVKSSDAKNSEASTPAGEGQDAALKNFEVGSREMVQINRTLKTMIENNSRLEEQRKDLEQQLTNIRGQRKIEVTRLEKLKAERDQLLAERDKYRQQSEGNKQDFSRLSEMESRFNKELADLKAKLAAKEKELQLALTQPIPYAPGTTVPNSEQVVINAQDVIDMRTVIKNLGDEIKQKEQENDAAVVAEKTKVESILRELQGKLGDLEANLTVKEQELAAFQKTAGVDSAIALQEKISSLDSQLAQKEKDLSALRSGGPSASIPSSDEGQKKIQDLQEQLAGKEKELADLKIKNQDNLSQGSQELQKKIRDLEIELAQVKGGGKADAALKAMPSGTVAAASTVSPEASTSPTAVLAEAPSASSADEQAAAAVSQDIPESNSSQTSIAKAFGDKTNEALLATPVPSEVPVPEAMNAAAPAERELSPAAAAEKRVADIPAARAPSAGAPAAEALNAAAAVPSATEGPAMLDRRNSLQVIAMMDTLNTEKEKLATDEAQVHYNMGNVFFHQGQFKRAAAEYRQAIALRPQDANAHFNLAFVSSEYLHDPKTALEHFRQYLWLNPEAQDKAIVQEKIIDAKLELGAQLDSGLEKDLRKEEMQTFSR